MKEMEWNSEVPITIRILMKGFPLFFEESTNHVIRIVLFWFTNGMEMSFSSCVDVGGYVE
jgi:hypothetical protein